tara:strand:- start:102 stop:332 length:231 start_codon:yes stop_codon:yes gene_type:complete
MTLEEYRKDKKLSYYVFGQMLGLNGQNPGTNVNRWCLTSKIKRFPNPEMVKKIIELTKGKVSLNDLYKAWYDQTKV